MKKMKLILISTIMLFFINVKGQEDALRLFGQMQTDQRLRFEGDNPWTWNENRLDLKLEKKSEKSKFFSDVWLRAFGFPAISKMNHLYDKNLTSPYNIEIREAYAEFYGFLLHKLDVKIGRQRIAWGTADKLNPTDNLNPYDLEDIWDFGRHSGSDAIRFSYYLNDNHKLEAVYIPFFKPANLPLGDYSQALMPEFNFPSTLMLDTINIGLQYNPVNDNLEMPSYNLKDGMTLGGKFKGFIGGFDYSISYIYGRDGLPLPVENQIAIDSILSFYPASVRLDINTKIIYPRVHIFGADIAGSLGNAGLWAEAALIKPAEKYVMSTSLPDISGLITLPVTGISLSLPDSVVLDNKPYFRFVLGTDYTFSNGIYLNFQYLHGFIHERGGKQLNDYFMLQIEKSFFNEKLKIVPLSGAFVVSEWNAVSENYALLYMPEMRYFPDANTEIGIGVRIIEGMGDNSFSRYKKYDELFFKVRYSF